MKAPPGDNSGQQPQNTTNRPVRLDQPYEVWAALYRQSLERADERRELRAPAEHFGLVLSTISHRDTRPLLKIWPGMLKVKIPMQARPPQLENVTRGEIVGFSQRSRKRLIESMMQWDGIKRGGFFITLTYHNYWSDDPRDWKRQLDNFLKRLKREYPEIEGFWRLEPQRRGAPHFHMLIAGKGLKWQELKDFVTKAWSEIAHQESEHHGKYATNVRTINSRRHAVSYTAKYVAKEAGRHYLVLSTGEIVEASLARVGRQWGTFGQVGSEPILEVRYSEAQERDMRAFLRRWLVEKKSAYAERFADLAGWQGYSLYNIGLHDNEDGIADWRQVMREGYDHLERSGY